VEGAGDQGHWEVRAGAQVRVLLVVGVLVLAAGVWMTVESAGRPDTPLVAFGPMAAAFGAWIVWGALRNAGWELVVGGPAQMRRHVATRLLSSGADIDPETVHALGRLSGPGAVADGARPSDPLLRLGRHGRLRWRRGPGLRAFIATAVILTGVVWMLFAVPEVPRWPGPLVVAAGVVPAATLLRDRRADRRRFRELRARRRA
jgi:hypothetical protein